MCTYPLLLGMDIGSTTVKLTVVEANTHKLLHQRYIRHQTRQIETACQLLLEVKELYPDTTFKIAVTGSGGETFSALTGAPYIQEVAANTFAIRSLYPDVRTAVELGGQDAKVIFFKDSNNLEVDDMRMNGVCAGGTGSFIDQISGLLEIEPCQFEQLASSGRSVYNISGRCGVFATTDIQTLLNQGVSKEDIALSSLHAIARQTIGGLSQGKTFNSKVIFEGGVLSFNPTLIKVFREQLALTDEDTFIPPHPEIMVAFGAAVSLEKLFEEREYDIGDVLKMLQNKAPSDFSDAVKPLFDNDAEKEVFLKRLRSNIPIEKQFSGMENSLDIYIGIDSGSTTAKFVFLNKNGKLIDYFYSGNHGDPIKTFKDALTEYFEKYREKGIHLNVLGVGTTGYGEELAAAAFGADFHTVETLSHTKASSHFLPDVSFILDIGGQDIKAIFIKNGIINRIVLNEACSSGCGAFLENYSKSINLGVTEIAQKAFESESPSSLGSRCTIFMNSSVTSELKKGKSIEDIAAGLCLSLAQNIFTKVVRITDFNELGQKLLIQGGVSKNDAVVRAVEMYTGKEVFRPPYPELMGAIGIALLTIEHQSKKPLDSKTTTNFLGFDTLKSLDYHKRSGVLCNGCSNHCTRTFIEFSNKNTYVTGHKCEKGSGLAAKSPKETISQAGFLKTNLLKDYNDKLIESDAKYKASGIRIGIPLVLDFYESYPFWKAFFEYFGNEVLSSGKSSFELLNSGLSYVPSDTVCLPAKISHGHIIRLMEMGAQRIFWPMTICKPKENPTAQNGCMCPVVQGYSLVAKKNNSLPGYIEFDTPVFHWHNDRLMLHQMIDFFRSRYSYNKSDIKNAFHTGKEAQRAFKHKLESQGRLLLKKLEGTSNFGVVITGRPYQYDSFIHHNLTEYFTELNIPVFTIENLPDIHKTNVKASRIDNHLIYHTRIIEAAYYAALHPNLELVQLVSFGCGHDSILSDEVRRIISTSSGKEPLLIKLDEMDTGGSLKLRIKSFVETVKLRNREKITSPVPKYTDPYAVKFTKKDKKLKTILAPHLSPTFSYAASKIFESQGFKFVNLPLGGSHAFQLGKKYVHNDICFPAQVNIGEIFEELESGQYDKNEVAIILSKNCDYCRSGQYQVAARQALDQNGYDMVPILTTGIDWKKLHPGYKLNLDFSIKMINSLPALDCLDQMCRAVRPYELNKGDSDTAFRKWREIITETAVSSPKRVLDNFKEAVKEFNRIPIADIPRKPRVGVLGEILVEYHAGANRNIETYLEDNGIEVYKPSVIDFFRRDPLVFLEMSKRSMIPNAWVVSFLAGLEETLMRKKCDAIFKIYQDFRFCEASHDSLKVMNLASELVDKTYFAGEGWLIPGSIIEMTNHGINSFIIVQPFSCMSNHITGRGLFKPLKDMYPNINLLAIDFDPDTSRANIENRLQMLIYSAKESHDLFSKKENNNYAAHKAGSTL